MVAVSPSSVYRVLSKAGRLGRRWAKPSKKGTGFHQPLRPHEHWHIDISYLNIDGTFYFLTSILDGYSRYIVHWEIRAAMTEEDVQIVVQRAKEKFPNENPRIISDNGSQFFAKDFKEFIRLLGMTHVRTSPDYPQSNGKLERLHGSIKGECIRPGTPLSLEDALRLVARYVEHYNQVRLHSAIGYITPADKLAGREAEIFADRDRKLEAAREQRQAKRQRARVVPRLPSRLWRTTMETTWAEDRAPVGTDPSADPGVVSEGWAAATLPPTSPRLQHQCDKSNRHTTRKLNHNQPPSPR